MIGAAQLPRIERAALFLDFDGTLVDLAETPGGIHVPEQLGPLLDRLSVRLGGALALVSGRKISDIERFLPGYDGVIVGGHGAERRVDGNVIRHPLAGSAALDTMTRATHVLAEAHPGFLVEDKPTGVVLHYRQAPDLAELARLRMAEISAPFSGIDLHLAKMAVELRPDDIGKDRAVAYLLDTKPFRGRLPVMLGDDATDEPAMRLCVEGGGTALKIGEGATDAPHRLPDPAATLALLAEWAEAGGPYGRTPDRHIKSDSDRG